MKRVLVILMCVGLMSVINALTITNGDFETGGGVNIPNVTGWYDYSTANFWEDAWQTNASWITPNGTNVVVFCSWDTVQGVPLAGSYLYQSMGASAGESSVTIGFDWGHPDDTVAGRHDALTVSILASDGTFVPDDTVDAYGAAGVTVLDYASFDHVRVGAQGTHGEIWSEVVELDVSGANVGDEIFLRFNNYLPEAGADPWPVLDNVEIVPEPITRYVDIDAPGNNDGSSWSNAFNHLQDAIASAFFGDSIWIAEGTYKPDQGIGQVPGNRNASFQLKNGVHIIGGFAGYGVADPEENNPELYPVILSGDLNGDDGPDFTNNSDNSYHIVTGSYATPSALLEGVMVTAGNANGSPESHKCGGGFIIVSGSPTIKNCEIVNNFAEVFGGGMWSTNKSDPTLINCTFNRNVAFHCGGGMSNDDNSNPTLNNCTFNENWSDLRGGGMYNWISCNPTLTGCSFIENVSSEGGGLCNLDHCSPIVTDCIFSQNWAGNRGGGIDNWIACDLVLTNCRLYDNFSDWSGGGLFSHESIPIVTSCIFSYNKAAHWGGGMYNTLSEPIVTNCTFVYNSTIRHGGGGISSFDASNPRLFNCILWANTATSGAQIHKDSTSLTAVTYSDVQGAWPGVGNMNSNPHFVNANANDYHLSVDSPCINSGDPEYICLPDETDLDGKPRIIGPVIDMGAYEYNHMPVAEAGTDQIKFAGIEWLVEVKLDGTASYDLDGDELDYFWYNDANDLIATGAEPNVILPTGEHIITLIINDGIVDSEPDDVVITVIEPLEVSMKLTPRTLNCRSQGNWVKAHITLPEEYTVEDIDHDRFVVMHSYGIESAPIEVFMNEEENVEITAPFNRVQVCSLMGDWPEMFRVYGFFSDGSIFYGQSQIRINPAGLKEIADLAMYWLSSCSPPKWCDGLDLNRDTIVNLQDYPLLLNSEVEFNPE